MGKSSHTSEPKMTLVRSTKGGPFRRSVIMPSKGLLNNPGENNCFMNSAVQVLWHLDVFRRSFRLLVGHACLEDCCIFCALKEIFEQFQESDESALPPDVLRNAMAKAYQDQRKFEIGRMGDAAECFEDILLRLHHHIAYGQDEDSCSAKHCIPHEKFALKLCVQTICKCGATSEQPSFFQFVNYVVASNLVREARKPVRNGHRPYQKFGEFLKVTSSFAESAPCPNEEKCAYKEKSIIPTRIHRKLLNCPDIVAIGISWETDRPSADYVMDVLDCLGKSLQVKDLFDTVVDSKAKSMRLRLVGIMTYYGKHYTTFVYNSKQETWFYLDDAEVKKIGKDWNVVRDRCVRGRHQPLLVFYANQEGELIKVTKAPQETKIVSQEELLVSRSKKVKQKGAKIEAEEKELDRTEKRKSLKKMVGSVLSRKKSVKTKAEKRGRMRYSGDHVLSVSGQKHQNDNELLSQSLDEQYFKENRFVDADIPKQKRKEDVRDQSIHKSPEIDLDAKKRKSKSPLKSSENALKANGGVPQAYRLENHLQHVKSIESKLDETDDTSDYYNPRKSQQKKRKSSETAQGEGRRRSDKMELDHQPRRFIDQGNAYAEIFGEAESLVVCSIAAEQEGNLTESHQLCNEANMRYKTAFGLQGITDKMRDIAYAKFLETQKRSRLLSNKLDTFIERAPKPADYKRDMSKTSDYGSLSDASGSPMTPAEYSVFNRNGFKENQEKNKIAETGGIQAKLNKDRKKPEALKHADDVPTKSFFTLPRIKKNHHRKLSSPQPPTKSEEEQLTKLLKNFDSGSQSTGKRSHTSGRSFQDLQYGYSRCHDGGQQVNSFNKIGVESPLNDIRDDTHDLVIANSDMLSSKIEQERLKESELCDTSILNHAIEVSRSGSSNSNRSPSLPTDIDGQTSSMFKKIDGMIVDLVPSAKASQGTRQLFSKTDKVKPKEDLHERSINEKNESNTREEYELDRFARPESSAHHSIEPRISIYDNVNSQGALSTHHAADASTSRDIHPAPLQTDYKSRSLDPETSSLPVSNRTSNPKPSGKKRSIFQVVMPRIFSMDNSVLNRKPKKPLETKVVGVESIVSMETREKQYAAMLNADMKTVSSTYGNEAPGSQCKTTSSEDFSKNSPVPDRNTNKIFLDMDSKHEESYVVDPEVAQEEVAMMTKHITEKRLFKNSGLQSISPNSSAQFLQSDVAFNEEYVGGYDGGKADSSKMMKNSSSPSYELDNVNEDKTSELEPQEEGFKKVTIPQKIVVASGSISERFSVDKNENEVAGGKLNDFLSSTVSNATLISSVNDSQVAKKSPMCTEDETRSLSKPSSNYFNDQLRKVEPPPRKNPDVYRSSELYKPKTDTWKHSVTRSYPEEERSPTGRPQPSSHIYHGNTLSRWTNQIDFSKSPRQMCQQCGTVTVEKPRKFCRKCQSDYV